MTNRLRRAVSALVATALGAGLLPMTTPASARPALRLSTVAPARVAPAAGVAFGLQPATRNRPDARTRYSYSATPGASFDDQIAVVNIGTAPITVSMYATDATGGKGGSFALLAGDVRPTDVGSWVSLGGRTRVTVPARTSRGPSYVIVPFRLAVPAHVTPGDHAGGIVVSLQGSAVNQQGVRVRLDQRVGMRIYARISGPLHPALAVQNVHLDYGSPALVGNPFADGTATVHYRVRNTGNVVLGATAHGSVSAWIGGSASLGTLPAVPPLLPGASVDLTAKVVGVFPGLRVSADVTVHPYAPPGPSVPHLTDASGTDAVWALPWGLIVLALVLLAAVALATYRIRHPRRVGAHARLAGA